MPNNRRGRGWPAIQAAVWAACVVLLTLSCQVSAQEVHPPQQHSQASSLNPLAVQLEDEPVLEARHAGGDARRRRLINGLRPRPAPPARFWTLEPSTVRSADVPPAVWVPPVPLLSQLADPVSGQLPTLRFAGEPGWGPPPSYDVTSALPSVHDLPLEPTQFSRFGGAEQGTSDFTPYRGPGATSFSTQSGLGPSFSSQDRPGRPGAPHFSSQERPGRPGSTSFSSQQRPGRPGATHFSSPGRPAPPPPPPLGYFQLPLSETGAGRPAAGTGQGSGGTLGGSDLALHSNETPTTTEPSAGTAGRVPSSVRVQVRTTAPPPPPSRRPTPVAAAVSSEVKPTDNPAPEAEREVGDGGTEDPDAEYDYFDYDEDEYYYYDEDEDDTEDDTEAEDYAKDGTDTEAPAEDVTNRRPDRIKEDGPERTDKDVLQRKEVEVNLNKAEPTAVTTRLNKPEPALESEPATAKPELSTLSPETTTVIYKTTITSPPTQAPEERSTEPELLDNEKDETDDEAITTTTAPLFLFANFPQFSAETTGRTDEGVKPPSQTVTDRGPAPGRASESSTDASTEPGSGDVSTPPPTASPAIRISRRPIPSLKTRPTFSKTYRFGKGSSNRITHAPDADSVTTNSRPRPTRPAPTQRTAASSVRTSGGSNTAAGTSDDASGRPSLAEIRAAIQPFSLAELLVESGHTLPEFLRSRPLMEEVMTVIERLRARREGRPQQPPSSSASAGTTATDAPAPAPTQDNAGPIEKAPEHPGDAGKSTTEPDRPKAAGTVRERPPQPEPAPADLTAILQAMKERPPPPVTAPPTRPAVTFPWEAGERRLPGGLAQPGREQPPSRATRRPVTTTDTPPPATTRGTPRRKTWSLAEILAEKKLSLPAFLAKGGNVKQLLLEYNGVQAAPEPQRQDSDGKKAGPRQEDGESDGKKPTAADGDETADNETEDSDKKTAGETKVWSLAEILRKRGQTLKQFISGGGNVGKILEEYNGADWRERKKAATAAAAAPPTTTTPAASPAPAAGGTDGATDTAAATTAAEPPTTERPTTPRGPGLVLPTRPGRTPPSLRPLFGEGGSYGASSGGLGLRLDGGDPPVYGRPLLRTRTGGGRPAPRRPASRYRPAAASDTTGTGGYRYQGDRFDMPASIPPDALFERVNQEIEPARPELAADAEPELEPADAAGSVRDAIITSGVVGGCALGFFVGLLVVCRWRQRREKQVLRPGVAVSSDGGSSASPLDTANIDLTNYSKAYTKKKSAGFWGSLRKSFNQRYATAYSESPYGGVSGST